MIAPVRMPVYFLSHGGGPWPWLDGPMRDNHAQLEESLGDLPGELPAAPKAILLISRTGRPAASPSSRTRPRR
jgi:hypothetical protein